MQAMHVLRWAIRLAALVVGVAGLADRGQADPKPPSPATTQVEFNRDIRPLLSDACFQCHGPDSAKRQADLRLDLEAGAKADLGGRAALVPGDVSQSELYQRLVAEDPVERMPPAKSGKSLTAAQIELIRRWIEQGAPWQAHWSFLPPRRPELPAVSQERWVRANIDRFVLARLEKEGLIPAPEADRTTLIRRVSLDLTGLPPTPDEVDAFLNDSADDAYENVVDRLLASERYGERMAVRWLDGARYADTSGYQSDGERYMWRWRDWVIDAYNRNLPFDQFTIEQLAGDLLPGATLDQQIASGFNRNHRGNGEGGIIPEEYAVEYVVDRVETTYTVWMGLTMGCGRCHDHKFDPLSQRDFYRSFAFFNNLPEYGRANKYGNSPPFIKAPTRDQAAQVAALDARLEAARAEFERHGPALAAAQADWERQIAPGEELDWTVSRSELFHAPLDAAVGDAAEKSSGSWKEGTGEWVPGRVGPAARFDGARFLDAGDQANFTFYEKFTLSAWIHPQGAEGGTILSRMTDVEQGDGYSLVLEKGKLQLNLVKRWLDDALRVETEAPLAADEWHHVLVSYDGSRLASGIRMFVDGRPAAQTVNLNLLNQPFGSKEPLRIGAGHGPRRRFRGLIDDVRIYGAVLTDGEALALSAADSISRIAAIRPDQRSAAQSAKLRAFFLDRHAPAEIRAAHGELRTLSGEREQLWDSVPTTMVMQELPQPRPAFVLVRGEYNKPGEPVTAALPGCLPAPPAETRMDRLGFARWLVDPGHPLTSRVAVNRMWQMLFGTGLVKTVDDFGAQGEWPSHPELLDWLAVEFMAPEGGGEPSRARSSVSPADPAPRPWDIKRLLRMILLSATYRQSSRVAPDLWQRDPDNRLLARGPRLRLPAEMVRDQALYASGLLVERVGGPSVKPYQPEGLWKELADVEYVQDHGESLYRRGMYTFWKRTVPPPTMITFDSAGRETCIVRETRTNTPLQALTLMNDVTFVEASRALAERAMHETDGGPDQRLTRAFRLVVSRRPTPTELAVLRGGWESQRERFAQDRAAAEKLLSQGEAPRDQQLDPVELAAYTTMAGVILNLDEAITKE